MDLDADEDAERSTVATEADVPPARSAAVAAHLARFNQGQVWRDLPMPGEAIPAAAIPGAPAGMPGAAIPGAPGWLGFEQFAYNDGYDENWNWTVFETMGGINELFLIDYNEAPIGPLWAVRVYFERYFPRIHDHIRKVRNNYSYISTLCFLLFFLWFPKHLCAGIV